MSITLLSKTLFLIILLIHHYYKDEGKGPGNSQILNEYNKYSSKSIKDDFTLIGSMRHALAHSDFAFKLTELEFNSEKYGNIKIPYNEVAAITNKMLLFIML